MTQLSEALKIDELKEAMVPIASTLSFLLTVFGTLITVCEFVVYSVFDHRLLGHQEWRLIY